MSSDSKNFLSVIARCKNEPFVAEFVQHYLDEGVDEIVIFDNGSDRPYPDDVTANDRVTILRDDVLFTLHPAETKSVMRHANGLSTEWLLYVDLDEFITTRRHSGRTIREELMSTFVGADCVKVPWVMMSANGRQHNPGSLLLETIHRWDHDRRHENAMSDQKKFRCRYDQIEVKCIYRPEKFEFVWDHHPHGAQEEIVCVDSVDNAPARLDPMHSNLREPDIARAFLVCYHYRVYSVEGARQKIQSNKYYGGFTLDDVMSTDHPELIDETLARKTRARRG